MNIKNSVLVTLLGASIFCTSNLPVHADITSSAVTQSQFNSGLNSSLWSFSWLSDSSIGFTTANGPASYASQALIYQAAPETWNMSFSIGSGTVSVIATTTIDGFNWSASSTMTSLTPITSLALGNTYQANNGQNITISSITINGGIPISGTLTADGSQAFSGLLITDSTPITSLNYTLSLSTPTTWEIQNDGNAALASMVMFPGNVEAAPEPSTWTMLGTGLLTLVTVNRLRKK